MAQKRSFLLRIDSDLLDELRRWADDDLRSLNGQMEFLLRRALGEAGRTISQKSAKRKSRSSFDPPSESHPNR